MSHQVAISSRGSFCAALDALKKGVFVRNKNWGDEFIVMMGAHDVSIDAVADSRLMSVLEDSKVESLRDIGNIRKINLTDKTVVNGWLPGLEDLISDDWRIYDKAEVALQTFCKPNPGQAVEDLKDAICGVLDSWKVSYKDNGDALATRGEYEGLVIKIGENFSYSVEGLNCETLYIRGTGLVIEELRLAKQANSLE